jgi:hypothetical protein
MLLIGRRADKNVTYNPTSIFNHSNEFYKPEDGLSSWTLLRVLLVETDRRFSSAYCLHYQDFIRSPVSTTLHSTTSQKIVIFILAIVRT